jgi:hypothetical protein
MSSLLAALSALALGCAQGSRHTELLRAVFLFFALRQGDLHMRVCVCVRVCVSVSVSVSVSVPVREKDTVHSHSHTASLLASPGNHHLRVGCTAVMAAAGGGGGDAGGGFEWPWQYRFPPFFTIQPNEETRAKQVAGWGDLICDYCRHHNMEVLVVAEAAASLPLFNNQEIKRQLLPSVYCTLPAAH